VRRGAVARGEGGTRIRSGLLRLRCDPTRMARDSLVILSDRSALQGAEGVEGPPRTFEGDPGERSSGRGEANTSGSSWGVLRLRPQGKATLRVEALATGPPLRMTVRGRSARNPATGSAAVADVGVSWQRQRQRRGRPGSRTSMRVRPARSPPSNATRSHRRAAYLPLPLPLSSAADAVPDAVDCR
jgi:hypothetical protein